MDGMVRLITTDAQSPPWSSPSMGHLLFLVEAEDFRVKRPTSPVDKRRHFVKGGFGLVVDRLPTMRSAVSCEHTVFLGAWR